MEIYSAIHVRISPMCPLNAIIIPKNAAYCIISAPFGRLGIQTELVDGSLMISKINYLPSNQPLIDPSNPFQKSAVRQLHQYFKNPSHLFDLPLKPQGTIHQQTVWTSVQAIPAGFTSTYGEIARMIRSGPRAVGNACGANPYPLLTPCHRVISAQGVGGFMKEDSPGFYRSVKIWLLRHEGVI